MTTIPPPTARVRPPGAVPTTRIGRVARTLTAAGLAAAMALGAAACSDDTASEDEPSVSTIPDPADGAADDVIQGNEDGQDLDDGNVPGSEADAELDEVEDDLNLDGDPEEELLDPDE